MATEAIGYMPKTARVCTRMSNPFTMGGNVNTIISTEVPVLDYQKIHGVELVSFRTPKGALRIAELSTGGIVGDSFEDVSESMKAEGSTIEETKEFIEDMKIKMSQMTEKPLSNEEFFKLYNY